METRRLNVSITTRRLKIQGRLMATPTSIGPYLDIYDTALVCVSCISIENQLSFQRRLELCRLLWLDRRSCNVYIQQLRSKKRRQTNQRWRRRNSIVELLPTSNIDEIESHPTVDQKGSILKIIPLLGLTIIILPFYQCLKFHFIDSPPFFLIANNAIRIRYRAKNLKSVRR